MAHAAAPRTGILRSSEVEFHRLGEGRAQWSWAGAAVAVESPATLCIYDGAATRQTDLSAPATDVDSLVAAVTVDVISADDGLRAEGELLTLGDIDPSRLVTQLALADGRVFGRTVHVDFGAVDLPPVPEGGADLIDLDLGQVELDRLADEYDRRWSRGRPLDMAAWMCAIAQTQLQDQILHTPVEQLDLRRMLSGSYLAGWFSGRWFAENGYQRPAPDELDMAAADNAVSLMRQGLNVAMHGTDDEVLAFLVDEKPERERGYLGGTGLVSLVSIVGYNLGYCLTVNEETADGALELPPADLLTADGAHPSLTSPEGPMPDGELLGCHFSPSYLSALDDMRHYGDAFAASRPREAARLKRIQDEEELRGRNVWTYHLGNAIKADQHVRQTVWALNNSFLSGTVGAALANMGAQLTGDVALARQCALLSSSFLKGGTLWAYSFGVGSPAPRTVPTWDLGTTPLRTD